MNKVKQGQVDCLGLLFERYQGPLFHFFFNSHNHLDDCQDLVQTVFYRILKYKDRFRSEGEFRVWLFTIAKNVKIDFVKKKATHPLSPIEVLSPDQYQTEESISHVMIQNEEIDRLKKALDKLDSEKKEILTLSKLEGLKYKEIGAIMGCSEGNVKIKVFRALKELKQIFDAL